MPIDGKPVKGRGAAVQVPNRFLKNSYGIVHWEAIDEVDDTVAPTTYRIETPKTIVNEVNSPDLGFRWSLNPYQGCEHGCSYCYARPTHEYWGYSAGVDFERIIIVKRNAPELLEQKLRSRSWNGESIMISGATDPYQPVERKEGITRKLLEVMLRFRNPVSVITKNHLILRDLELLSELASMNLATVAISITTLDEELRRVMEPRTSSGLNRLRAVEALSNAGVPVVVMVAPIIPALNDKDIPAILNSAADAGARTASYTVVRTNGAVKPVFENWLRSHFPDRADKVIAQIMAVHGGSMEDTRSGLRMKGEGAYALSINRLFTVLRKRYFAGRSIPATDSSLFRLPPQGQLDLFA
ncbi:MAG: PA0069 family radical SAM protein [Flavobacteriales bacterium]|nr:PA0069 family radical SAM protein [Flavobacteriales bacterium]